MGVSLDGTRENHDLYRMDAAGQGTWDKVTSTIALLDAYGVETNLLCVVTGQLARKPQRAFKSLCELGRHDLQFIPCLDPLDTIGGQAYSLTPEHYGRFLCGVFDAWYDQLQRGNYVSVRNFEDYLRILLGMPPTSCASSGSCGHTSPLLLLFDWMEYLIKDDMLFLQDYEENLSHLEEELLEGNMEDFDRKILLSRKELSVLSAYYEQLSDMGETLQQNAARHQTEQEALLFGLFCEKAGRLYDMVQTLKEYSMQLREMHQTQIDIRQNEIMKVLTIVTTLFMPLTLIAGWYGMNFAHMPELTAPGGYGIICVVCLLLIAVEIWIFKKKGWFK